MLQVAQGLFGLLLHCGEGATVCQVFFEHDTHAGIVASRVQVLETNHEQHV